MASFSVFSVNDNMVMVHKGWDRSSPDKFDLPRAVKVQSIVTESRSGIQKEETKPQNLEFVNGTDPFHNRDPDVRKLVRAHVIHDRAMKRKILRGETKVAGTAKSDVQIPPSNNRLRRDEEMVVVGRALDPHPHLTPAIHHITTMGAAMWPLDLDLKFNPISPASWFNWALREEVLFHALLYTTSSYAALMSGTTGNLESIRHVGKVLGMLRDKVSTGRAGEGVIAAVSCLALTEAIKGNSESWLVHMIGIKEMVALRGGVKHLSLSLQLKIHRADLTGAVDFLHKPFFWHQNSLPSAYISAKTSANTPLQDLLETLTISKSLLGNLVALSVLSKKLSTILKSSVLTSISDQIALLKATYALRYEFLESPTLLSTTDREYSTPSISELEKGSFLEEALRLGSLLYMQATLQEFPSSAVGSMNLVRRLKSSVMSIQVKSMKEGMLLVWMLFIGAMEAQAGEWPWFVEQIRRLVSKMNIDSWHGLQRGLVDLWWVESIHGGRGRKIWDEVIR